MSHSALLLQQPRPRRVVSDRSSSGGGCGGNLGCFALILLGGGILYLILRGRGDRQEVLGASKRPMGSGPLQPVTFACPYPKCPTCGGSSDKMRQQWDGMRKVTWTCGYCSAVAGVQELKDEELPASARQRLGLDAPAQAMPGQGFNQGYGGGGGGIGNLLTGMMIGSMMGGDHHHDRPRDDDWTGGSGSSGDGGGTGGSDWGESSGGGSDWGDSGGSSDSGGGDSGGGDSGGGSDW